ncbi:MAG TPA: hypothetical protein P5089_02420 [Candidatus Portnoybacteria bacterium]|nr:hypothetical protein [Candidatus Portnoybacteria bacterium]
MNIVSMNKIKWAARISAVVVFAFIFPFYIGYGIPVPNAALSFFENVWIVIMPLFLIGLIIGWKWEKIGGCLVVAPIIFGFLVSLFLWESTSFIMALPLIPGFLYLIYGYKK